MPVFSNAVALERHRAPVRENERERRAPSSIIASVVMNGGRLSLTTGSALTSRQQQPTATATTSVVTIKRETAEVQALAKSAITTPVSGIERADREIDAGGDDDERLADGEDRVVGDLPQHVGQVAGGEEVAVRKRR